MIQTNFEIDPQLDSSSIWIQDLPLCQVRLKNDCRFPWIVLIPRRPEIVEVFDLRPENQHTLWLEIARVGQHMHQHFQAHKINIEILGNRVRQLHIHIIARYTTDAAWPNSVLNHGLAETYLPDEMENRIQDLSCFHLINDD